MPSLGESQPLPTGYPSNSNVCTTIVSPGPANDVNTKKDNVKNVKSFFI